MVLDITVTMLKNDMKRLGLKGYSKIRSDRKTTNIFTSMIVDELIDRKEIKPYRRARDVMVTTLPCKFQRYLRLTKKDRNNVKHVWEKEGETNPSFLASFLYCTTTLPIKKLPPSAYDDIYELRQYFDANNAINFATNSIYRIYKIQHDILKNGFRKDRPILIYICYDHYECRGGNHRLQAVRNLVNEKKLPRNTKIPCIIMIDFDDAKRYKIDFEEIRK